MKFLFVYYGGMMAATPAEQKKSMQVWTDWFGKLGKSLVDMGAPTKPGKLVTKDGIKAIGETPVAGWSVVMADDMDAAVKIAKSHPDVAKGMKVAVYEVLPM
ncbi:MAG: hypothetical protein PHE50_00805 [Dehalococcoidales bacterium]|nr:hypothetical protein [Dehalococcoidales bacterium]